MPGPGPRSQVQVPGLRPESRGGGEKRRELSVACVCSALAVSHLRFTSDLNMDTVGVSLRGRHVRVFVARNASAYCGGSFLSSSLYCLHNE
jgi:hypothetical protein